MTREAGRGARAQAPTTIYGGCLPPQERAAPLRAATHSPMDEGKPKAQPPLPSSPTYFVRAEPGDVRSNAKSCATR